jgi:hypothetical protein
VIDKDGSGVLDLADITAAYDASKHPEVIAGKKTKAEVFREFIDNFDGGEKDGMVYPEEFERYYATISASIDDDDYFEVRRVRGVLPLPPSAPSTLHPGCQVASCAVWGPRE